MILLVAIPIGIATMLALPMHKSIGESEIRDRAFASLRSTHIPYTDVVAIAHVDGYRLRDGSFKPLEVILVRQANGQVWDSSFSGDNIPPPDGLADFLSEKTHLPLQSVSTREDLHW